MKYTLLLYHDQERDIKNISYEAAQLGMSVSVARDHETARAVSKDTFFELAIINTGLPFLALSKDTKVMTIGDHSARALFDDEAYQRKRRLAQPLTHYAIRYGLICVSGLTVESYTYPSNVIRILAMLRKNLFVFDCLHANDNMFKQFKELSDQYCVESCMFGIAPHEVTERMAEYTPIALASPRGTVVCKFYHTCMLHRFSEHLKSNKPELFRLNALAPLVNDISNISQKYFAGVLEALNSRYVAIIKAIIDEKEEFCAGNCYQIDEASTEYQKKTKILCCEYGCVMDNYFDVTPQATSGKKQSGNVLLYMAESNELKILAHYCGELGLDVFTAATPDEVAGLFQAHEFDLAIVDYERDKIKIPARTSRIVVGRPTIAATASIISYLPVCFIPTPFELVRIALGVLKALGNYYEQPTIMALLQNLSIYLESLHMSIQNMITDEKNKGDFYSACVHYCENNCQFIRKRSDLDDSEISQYQAIHSDIRKSHVYCKYRKECPLWAYMEWMRETDVALDLSSPSQLMQTFSVRDESRCYRDWLEAIIRRFQEHLAALFQTKVTYCTQVCPRRKKDLDFKKGDTVLDPSQKLLQEGSCSYCQYHECPQKHFFEYFIQTIV
jgi:hypothetical protein